MQYNMGESLADHGFPFLEKLHSPIFLFHKSGTLKHVNEAGRKLLRFLRIPENQAEGFGSKLIAAAMDPDRTAEYQRVRTAKKQFRIISKKLGQSDYVLVEIVR